MSIHISEKALQDLEFTTVLQQVATFSISGLGKKEILDITPFTNKKQLLDELDYTNEYLSSFVSENRIPNHGFDNIYEALKRLTIENSYIEPENFLKIASISESVKEQKNYFKKLKTYYPSLFSLSERVEFLPEIIEEIKKVITAYGEIIDNASPELRKIRRSIAGLQGKIGQSFASALGSAKAAGYLDDIKESVIDNHRVLAVLAMHRKKVNGSLLGSSKSGSIVYIAPQATLAYQRELQNLVYEEKQEVIRILRALSEQIRPYAPVLESYLVYLTHLDVIGAKAKYAHAINGLLPTIGKTKRIFFKNAYHPILWVKNQEANLEVIPQTIELNEQQQIIVISGPNAGGKSITLKTIGLLQVMIQSGILIPVDERSETTIFDNLLTDIGDNQSIENQLSTYSYRLKNMRYFLRKCSERTLFLIDEFGTGSDPELGGALAEIFLEEFYHKKAFGIITTHYSNLKVLADELDHVTNANMQFNERTLEPLYKLYVGQAGSSFTFEVAQKNGIPFSLINRSKKKIERGKIRFDKTIAKLQKERSKLEKTERALKQNEIKKSLEADKLETTNAKAKKKLQSYQELFDSNQRLVYLGQKISDLGESYFENNRKRELMNELFKLVQIENSKRQKISLKQKKAQKIKETELKKEVDKKVEVIRKEKKQQKAKAALIPPKPKRILVIGDSVRLEDGRAVGTLDKLEKNKAVVNYGLFTTTVNIDRLEYVNSKK